MAIPRLHLFELEDQPWFPAVIRDYATDYLHFMEKRFALHRPSVEVLADALRITGEDQVIDLCAGGAGPVPALQKDLKAQGLDICFVLTDRFPNVEAFKQAAAASEGAIIYVTEPVDARAVPTRLAGFRTVFNAFHHFRPADAVAVLQDAARAGRPIGVFEIADRRPQTLLPIFFLTPLLVALTTPFIRPFRWSRLFWTYVAPLVPCTCWWDGVVSQLRAYTCEEFERLARRAGGDGYTWRVGRKPVGSTPGRLTYLVGYPQRHP